MHRWPITFSLPQGLTIGGLTSWAFRLTEHLLHHDHRVRWMIHDPLPGHAELPASALPDSPRFEAIRLPSLMDRAHWDACIRAYRNCLPTILLPAVHTESYGIAAALAMVVPDELRVLAWNHSDNPYDYAYLTRYEPIIHRYIVNTKTCQGELRRRLPARSDEILLVPHGVCLPEKAKLGATTADTSAAQRDEHAADATRPIRIAYGGRIEHLVKRVLDFPRLASALDALGVRFELRVVGDGPQCEEFDRLAAEVSRHFQNRDNRVSRLPAVSFRRIHELWHWADVSMLMSAHEGLSVGMLEAMAAGCVPVVTAVASGAGDVITNGENGYIFPIGDVEQAARIIQTLAADSKQRKRLARNAVKTIESRHSFERFANEVVSVLDTIQSDSPRSWPVDRSPFPSARVGEDDSNPPGETIPHDAAVKLRSLLAGLADNEDGPIAIYGAGRHTRALSEVWAESPVEIVGVIDDDPSLHGRQLWGWPIVAPCDAVNLGANAIVISSWMHESALWHRRTDIESQGITVHRIYETLNTMNAAPSEYEAATMPVDAVVTLLVWDAHEAVSRLLKSLRRGVARDADWRLFILDQGSERPTREILERFAADNAKRVHLHRLDENIGYPAGHNLLHGLAAQRYESRYLITLNSDLVFRDSIWLDRMIDFMDQHPMVALAGPTGVVYQRTPLDRLGWCRVATPAEASAGQYDSISGSVCIIRQSVIDDVGLFDECFTPGYYEDTDFAFRAVAAGWQIAICPVDHGHHDLGPEKSTASIKREELAAKYGNFQKRNRDIFVKRWLTSTRGAATPQELQTEFKRLYVPKAKLLHAR